MERFELPTYGFGDRRSANWNYTHIIFTLKQISNPLEGAAELHIHLFKSKSSHEDLLTKFIAFIALTPSED